MGRSPCCSKEGLNKGAWTVTEDKILIDYIKIHGEGKWRKLPSKAGLNRCGKSCRLRWLNYLRPDIKRGNITKDEEDLIIRLHKLLGNRWSLIAGRLPGRTDNEIKNYWNTNIFKKRGAASSRTVKRSVSKKENLSANQHDHLAYSLGSHVIRTKAKRASEVYIPMNPQSTENHESTPISGQSHVEETENHQANNLEYDQLGLEEFKVEDKFFCDLFDTEFFTFSKLGDHEFGDESNNNTKITTGCSSANSSQILDEKLRDFDIGSMISIDPAAMDWFHD